MSYSAGHSQFRWWQKAGQRGLDLGRVVLWRWRFAGGFGFRWFRLRLYEIPLTMLMIVMIYYDKIKASSSVFVDLFRGGLYCFDAKEHLFGIRMLFSWLHGLGASELRSIPQVYLDICR